MNEIRAAKNLGKKLLRVHFQIELFEDEVGVFREWLRDEICAEFSEQTAVELSVVADKWTKEGGWELACAHPLDQLINYQGGGGADMQRCMKCSAILSR